VSAQIVFFSASNYVSQVAVTPGTVTEFYTNYLAQYRLPDRVQVSYVEFNVSNYFAAAEQTLGKTNLDNEVQNIFRQEECKPCRTPRRRGGEGKNPRLPDPQTGRERRAKGRKRAGHEVFNQTPASAEISPPPEAKGIDGAAHRSFSSCMGRRNLPRRRRSPSPPSR